MDPLLKIKLISQAKEYLVQNPQDPMHDLAHHQRVVNLALNIIAEERLEGTVDKDLVEVICWWHDVKVPGVEYPADVRVVEITANFLVELVPEDLKHKVHDSIINHEFGSTPQYLEGQILQDADKLEILSEPRVDTVIENVTKGVLDKPKMLETLNSIRTDWLPKMPERYHFNYSRNYHEKTLPGFLDYLQKAEEQLRMGELR